MVKKFKSTKEVDISKKIIDQVVGQEEAVNIIRKASAQRRHVLLIGEPGTGKSMLGMALAELLSKEKLVDTLSFANPHDENQPLVRIVPAGQGRKMVSGAKMQSMNMFKNQNIIIFILVILAMIAPWWALRYYSRPDQLGATGGAIIFAAFFLGAMVFLASFIIFINVGKKSGQKGQVPKLIVDNFKKKQAPFFDATGAHAGALLGDVLHDPFQCFIYSKIYFKEYNSDKFVKKPFNKMVDNIFAKHKNLILTKKNNYEAVHLPKNELFVLGESNGSVSSVEVLSSNRHDYVGEMIKLTTFENKELIVTPEHKIAIWKNGKIAYVEARNIKEGNEVVAQAEDIIIDEQDIINTYSKEQQALAKSYYKYLELRKQNPSWGYKRLATKLGVSYGRTRWWWEKNSAPVPVQTANWLKGKGLLPLKIDNPKLPLIAKILGATFGDGGIFQNLNGIFLSSSEKEAVEEFGRDIEEVFGLKLNENSRIIEGGEYGHSWCYQNANRNVIRLFQALGAPKGNKTNLELITPKWIRLNQSFEDEFYASFLGGELGSPSQHIQKNRLTTLEVGISGRPEFEENRIAFLEELANYLSRKGVKTTSIYKGKIKDSDNFMYRLNLSTVFDNVLKFLIEIKLNYCKYKVDRTYTALGKWAMWKKKKYYELIERGHGAEHAMGSLNLTPHSLYLLLNHFGENKEELTA